MVREGDVNKEGILDGKRVMVYWIVEKKLEEGGGKVWFGLFELEGDVGEEGWEVGEVDEIEV